MTLFHKRNSESFDTIPHSNAEYSTESFASQNLLEQMIDDSSDGIIVMDKIFGDWDDIILSSRNPKASDLLFAIFPTAKNDWDVQAIALSINDLDKHRKLFPKEWRGLRGKELQSISGIKSAVFCHPGGFFAVIGDKDDAIAFTKKAISF